MTYADFGRATEARFTLDASLRGFLVSRPESEAPGYDRILDNGERLFRVQIKGARPSLARGSGYTININRHRRRLPAFDEVAIWLDGHDRWTFLPASVRERSQIQITASGRNARRGWEVFRLVR